MTLRDINRRIAKLDAIRQQLRDERDEALYAAFEAGMDNRNVAREAGLTIQAVANHRARLTRKFG